MRDLTAVTQVGPLLQRQVGLDQLRLPVDLTCLLLGRVTELAFRLGPGVRLPAGIFGRPLGLRRLVAQGATPETLSWMWGLNGAASVLAAPLALIVSMESGIGCCLLLSGACYVVAALVPPRSSPEGANASLRA